MQRFAHPLTAVVTALLLIAAVPGTAHAQTDTASMTDGEIRKLDKEAGKLTIKHGEIKNLDMPGMTMVFVAKEKSLLDSVQVGDKVKFVVVHEDGKFVVTDIHTVK